MTLAHAQQADRRGSLVEAAGLYEAALREGPIPVDILIDLAVLYWQATEYGFWVGNHLPEEFVQRAGDRYPDVFRTAEETFPGNAEVEFWRSYVAWADTGKPMDEVAKRLFASNPEELTPVLYLFSASQGLGYETEAAELLRQSRENLTTRAKYVISVLEAAFKRKHPSSSP